MKNELMTLIEQLPEDKMGEGVALLKKLIEKQDDGLVSYTPLENMETFMKVVVNSLTNAMYDLSVDAKRREDKVMANRFEAYRKKISEGWEIYHEMKEEE